VTASTLPAAAVEPRPSPSSAPPAAPNPTASSAAAAAVERAETSPAEPAAPAYLALGVTPWAQVAVDGKAVGRSPLSLRLTAGSHTLVLSHPSYLPLRRVIIVKAGETKVLKVDLRDEAVKKP